MAPIRLTNRRHPVEHIFQMPAGLPSRGARERRPGSHPRQIARGVVRQIGSASPMAAVKAMMRRVEVMTGRVRGFVSVGLAQVRLVPRAIEGRGSLLRAVGPVSGGALGDGGDGSERKRSGKADKSDCLEHGEFSMREAMLPGLKSGRVAPRSRLAASNFTSFDLLDQ